jgi:hypothetical protein
LENSKKKKEQKEKIKGFEHGTPKEVIMEILVKRKK